MFQFFCFLRTQIGHTSKSCRTKVATTLQLLLQKIPLVPLLLAMDRSLST